MQVKRVDNSTTNVTLIISAEAADLAPIRRHVVGHFASNVKVPGFRSGKAPVDLVEKNINQQILLEEFMEHALNDLYNLALKHEKLRPVAQPDVQLKKFVPYSELEFEAVLDVVGGVKLADYKKIKLFKKPVSVSASDVNEVLAQMRQRGAERKAVGRPAKNGDEVVIDFSGKDQKAQPIAGAEGKDYPLIIGSDSFIPGFEKNLIGLRTGESKEFTLTFPKDYAVSVLQGQKATFKVDVRKVNELKQAKLDDEFAGKLGPFKDLAELKADIKKQLKAERQEQAERQYESELIARISDKSSLQIPPRLVDEQVELSEEEEKRNLAYRGQTWQEHLKAEGVTEEQHRQRQRPDAEARVKAGLVLSEIAEHEKIEVHPEELDIRIKMLKGQYSDPAMQAELDKPENRRDIAARLMTEKTLAKLKDYSSK
jgi:trigger factor